MLWVLEKGTGEVWTKPGEITWKKYMEDRGTSHATSHYRIEHWEHPGIGFMESAKKRLSVRFSVEMDTAL